MTTETGGPAFPTLNHNMRNDGMTLRDYFATHASEEDIRHWQPMNVMVTHIRDDCGRRETYRTPGMYGREVARYRYADAMLRAGILV